MERFVKTNKKYISNKSSNMEIINLQKQREEIKKATYNIEEIAKLLGVSYKLASKLVHSKGFPKIQIGRRILVPRDLFWEWLKNNPEIKI